MGGGTDVFRVIDSHCGCGTVAKQMRIYRCAESPFRDSRDAQIDTLALHRLAVAVNPQPRAVCALKKSGADGINIVTDVGCQRRRHWDRHGFIGFGLVRVERKMITVVQLANVTTYLDHGQIAKTHGWTRYQKADHQGVTEMTVWVVNRSVRNDIVHAAIGPGGDLPGGAKAGKFVTAIDAIGFHVADNAAQP